MVEVSWGQLWITSQIKKVGTLEFKKLERYNIESLEKGSNNRVTIDAVVYHLKVSEPKKKFQIPDLTGKIHCNSVHMKREVMFYPS